MKEIPCHTEGLFWASLPGWQKLPLFTSRHVSSPFHLNKGTPPQLRDPNIRRMHAFVKAKCQPCFPKAQLINHREYLVYPAPLRSFVHPPCSTQDGRLLSFKSVLRSRPLTGNSPSMFLNVEFAWSKPTKTQDLYLFIFYSCAAQCNHWAAMPSGFSVSEPKTSLVCFFGSKTWRSVPVTWPQFFLNRHTVLSRRFDE